MARELIKKSVDGIEYEFMQFGAKQSVKLLTRLLKIIGEPLSLAVGAASGQGGILDKQLDPGLLGKAVKCLTEKMDEDAVLDLIEEFTARDHVMANGVRVVFDTHYEGRLPHMFKVLMAALEVQYGNFFKEFPVVSRMGGIANRSTTPAPQT